MCNIWWQSNKNDVEKELEYLQTSCNMSIQLEELRWRMAENELRWGFPLPVWDFRGVPKDLHSMDYIKMLREIKRRTTTCEQIYKHQYWLSYAIVQIRLIKSLGTHVFRISYTWWLVPAKSLHPFSRFDHSARRMLSQAVIVFTSTSATYYFWALLPAWEVWYKIWHYGLFSGRDRLKGGKKNLHPLF